MDSVSLSPKAALKLVEVYQLVHDIRQLQQEPAIQQWQDFLICGQIIKQRVDLIFQATSHNMFLEEVQDLLDIIEKILECKPLKYADLTSPIAEKLHSLKNMLILIQYQSETK